VVVILPTVTLPVTPNVEPIVAELLTVNAFAMALPVVRFPVTVAFAKVKLLLELSVKPGSVVIVISYIYCPGNAEGGVKLAV
jgi:hypothetical protein